MSFLEPGSKVAFTIGKLASLTRFLDVHQHKRLTAKEGDVVLDKVKVYKV
jgi:hypothetical protein